MSSTIKKIKEKGLKGVVLYTKGRIALFYFRLKSFFMYYSIKFGRPKHKLEKISLCGGPNKIAKFFNTDICVGTDLYLDLERKKIPFKTSSVETLVCISAINYFSKENGEKIINDIYKIMRPGGVVRFGTQDLDLVAKKYVEKDVSFFFQKLPNGKERFIGETMGDKFNSWFYGYAVAKGKGCKYFYDFETLALIFRKAGFSKIENKKYLDSKIENIEKIDNRPDQMFFLEAVK